MLCGWEGHSAGALIVSLPAQHIEKGKKPHTVDPSVVFKHFAFSPDLYPYEI